MKLQKEQNLHTNTIISKENAIATKEKEKIKKAAPLVRRSGFFNLSAPRNITYANQVL